MGIFCAKIETPLGEMTACATQQGICLLDFSDAQGLPQEIQQVEKHYHQPVIYQESIHLQQLRKELRQYFSGKIQSFSVKISPVGTAFQRSVWQVLQQIPYGATISYKTQAERLGNPKAIRAVARANGQNKIAIVVPCHRVIGSNSALTGYAGGLWRKRKLLELEGVLPKELF